MPLQMLRIVLHTFPTFLLKRTSAQSTFNLSEEQGLLWATEFTQPKFRCKKLPYFASFFKDYKAKVLFSGQCYFRIMLIQLSAAFSPSHLSTTPLAAHPLGQITLLQKEKIVKGRISQNSFFLGRLTPFYYFPNKIQNTRLLKKKTKFPFSQSIGNCKTIPKMQVLKSGARYLKSQGPFYH